MRRQRYMGVTLVVISWFVLFLALTGETPDDQDATAAVLTLPLGLYMMFTEEYILYDGEPLEPEPSAHRRRREAELDPWAPTSPGAAIDPLFPWSSWGPMEGHTTNMDIKKGVYTWQGKE